MFLVHAAMYYFEKRTGMLSCKLCLYTTQKRIGVMKKCYYLPKVFLITRDNKSNVDNAR